MFVSNHEYVERFLEGRGLASGSERNYWKYLRALDRFVAGKDFRGVTEDDLRGFYRCYRRLKPSSKHLLTILLKNFFRHLHGYRKYTYPPCVQWLGTLSNNHRLPVVSPNDLLREEDVKALLDATYSTRDRALWMVLWEGGLRIGEALSMRVGSIVFDEYGCHTIVDGKTGPRRMRFVQATPYLREWLNVHPHRDDVESWLWAGRGTRRLHYGTVDRNLKRAGMRAGLRKRVNCHLFRHSRLTVNAQFMTEAQLCTFAGWTQGSSQTRTYVHLSGLDLDDVLLTHYGLKNGETHKPEEQLQPLRCPRCHMQNPATGKICFQCGSYLTLHDALRGEAEQKQKLDILTQRMTKLEEELEQHRALTKAFLDGRVEFMHEEATR